MGLMIDQSGSSGEYEAVALPPAPGTGTRSLGSAVFRRRSARPSRRAVLHLHDMTGSFAPADLARWYNERGFHFYVADIEVGGSHRPGRPAPGFFAAMDAACQHMRQADGIDAIILSAEDAAAAAAALWCDARRTARPVDALILSSPQFGRALHGALDITCPVLVISARPAAGARHRRPGGVSLGQHVTWLYLDQAAEQAGPDPFTSEAASTAQRRRLFDEMGRWLGAYMYGQVRDQLL
jgi:hypothetical protein